LTLPRIEVRMFPWLLSPVTASEATAIYSAIASGTIALTGIVFSLVCVMVQFGATRRAGDRRPPANERP
jgi:uncharacterized membrane protein